jgi:hypothetical protein
MHCILLLGYHSAVWAWFGELLPSNRAALKSDQSDSCWSMQHWLHYPVLYKSPEGIPATHIAQYSVGSKRVRAVVLVVARQVILAVYGSAGGSTIVALFLKLIEADCDGLLSQKFCWNGPGEPDSQYRDYFASEGDGVYPRAATGQLSRPGKLAPSDWCTSRGDVPRETMWIEPLALASQLNIVHIWIIVEAFVSNFDPHF